MPRSRRRCRRRRPPRARTWAGTGRLLRSWSTDISIAVVTRQPARTPGPAANGDGGLIADRAYVALRDLIVTLRLAPGAAQREDALMRDLGLGRTPLREAVKRLALEGLVEVRPRSGTFVTAVQAADIVHIAEVRAELEAQAARLAAGRMDDELRTAAGRLDGELRAMEGTTGI